MNTKWKKILLAVVLFSVFQSSLISIGYADTCGLKDEFTVKHIWQVSGVELHDSTTTYAKVSEDTYSMSWNLYGYGTGTWNVNTSTRLVSDMVNFGPKDGSYCWTWIFTDVSIGENVTSYQYARDYYTMEKHTNFTVTGETTHGDMDVWVLEDQYGSVRLYEKTIGFLVNYTDVYNPGWETFTFVETDAFKKIPGYSMPIIVVLLALTSLGIIYKLKKQK